MKARFTVTVLALALGACGGGSAEDAAGIDGAEVRVSAIRHAFDVFRAQRTGARFGADYADGTRVEACWKNPASQKLSDLKKAFYCAVPLEFRICNSPKLLTTDDAQVQERYRTFQRCKRDVDAALGSTGEFVYDAQVDRAYLDLFLRDRATLTPAEEAALVAANRPASSGREFPELLFDVASGVAREAVRIARPDFDALVRSYDWELQPSLVCEKTADVVGGAATRCRGDRAAARSAFISVGAGGSCSNVKQTREQLDLLGRCLPWFDEAPCGALIAGDVPATCRAQLVR